MLNDKIDSGERYFTHIILIASYGQLDDFVLEFITSYRKLKCYDDQIRIFSFVAVLKY